MKKRVISAAVLLAIVIPLLILGDVYFAIGVTAIGLLGYKEIMTLRKEKYPLLIKIVGALLMTLLILFNFVERSVSFTLDYRLLALVLLILAVPVVIINDSDKYNSTDALYLIGFILFVGFAFSLLITLREMDIKYLITIILITTMTDMFAQIFGMLIGKHKLIPKISPNKTWEGTIMGSVMGTIVASSYYLTFVNTNVNTFIVIGIVLLLTVVAQIGDLFFSAIKRLNGVKDFSNLMPGHGGVLDRFDSLIFTLIAFTLIIKFL